MAAKDSQSVQQEPAAGESAVVVSASRRHILVTPDGSSMIPGTIASKAMDVVPGDLVRFEMKDQEAFITGISERRNSIERTYRGSPKRIASNLDRLFVVAAVLPAFNTIFIDRVLTVASVQDIPCSLILNKIDLGSESTRPFIDLYRSLGLPVHEMSAKFGQGLEEFIRVLQGPGLGVAALAGVSGVGKSTILNRLIPSAGRKTGEVSQKTGTGRQTTTQSCGYVYERPDKRSLLLIDLPGIQNFGVSHLAKGQVADSFPEIVTLRESCEFSDCAHLNERECAVKSAVENKEMPASRYLSYVHMLEEIENAREY